MAKKRVKRSSSKSNSRRVSSSSNKKGVSEALAIVCLVLNIIILPGLGSLIGRRTKEGIWQIVLVLGGLIVGLILTLTIIGAIIGIPLMIVAPIAGWIWGIVTGIDIIKKSHK